MRNVGKKLGLQIGSPPQVVGALVELGVKRDHAAVRVFQLAIQQRQLFLARAQLLQRLQQLLVLPLDFLVRTSRRRVRNFCAKSWTLARESR